MGNMDKTTGIRQFNGSNFSVWKFRVEKHLASHGCLNANLAEGAAANEPNNQSGEEFLKMDCKAQYIISSFISDDYLQYIRDEKSAQGMWKTLSTIFERKSC